MKYPDFKEEKKLWKQGYKFVVGIDEAGRGPLAGPVVAGAAMVKINKKLKQLESLKVNDSKKISPKRREEIYKVLIKHSQIYWGAGRVSEKVIDRINIFKATKLAMQRAIKNLEKKNSQAVDFLIIDGNFKINFKAPQKSIVKGDEKVFSCAAASIIAKVVRDKAMKKYHKKYPRYHFDRHKGYGTKLHFRMLEKYGYCKIHRKTFASARRIN